MIRLLLLLHALLLLPACDRPLGPRNLAGATTHLSDTELARERILIMLRDIRGTERDYEPTLAIVIEPDGTVVTRRSRFFSEPQASVPAPPLQEPDDLFGPGMFDVVDRTDRAPLPARRLTVVRRRLSAFRPQSLSRDYASLSAATLPSCSRTLSHDASIVGVYFLAPGGESGFFNVTASCSAADEATVRAIIEDVRRLLPQSQAAAGFSY